MVVALLAAALDVDQQTTNLQLNSATCGGDMSRVDVPPQYANPGVAADLVIFVTGISTAALGKPNTIAFASFCEVGSNGRPVAGNMNIGPNLLSLDPALTEDQLKTIVHEITHVLGFSSSMYQNAISTTNRTYTGFAPV